MTTITGTPEAVEAVAVLRDKRAGSHVDNLLATVQYAGTIEKPIDGTEIVKEI